MARQHTTEAGYTNPEVKFERTDIDTRGVVRFGIGFGGLVVVATVLMWGLYRYIERLERQWKESDLPAAAVDASKELPPIPLEGIEDLEKKNPRLFPPRAAEDAGPKLRRLDEGDAKAGVLKIDDAIAQYAADLKARDEQGKRKASPPPTFPGRLPSKAASGREPKGGK